MIKLYSQHKNYNRGGFSPEVIAKLLPKCIARGKSKQELDEVYRKKFDTTKEHNNVLMVKEGPDNWAMYVAKEGHASVFYYPDDAFKEKEKDGKVLKGILDTANYTGPVYTDWYYFDGDLDNDIAGCIVAISDLLEYLHANKLFHLLFFSGKKGFHLYIPISLIEVPKELDGKADLVCRYFLDQLLRQFPALNKIKDPQVYSRNHLFRLPWSSHDKTNKIKRLYEWVGKKGNENNPIKWVRKVPITIDSMKTINNILSKPMDLKPHWKLEIRKKLVINKKAKTLFDFNTPYMGKVCIFEMLKDPNPKAKGLSRHSVALTLLAYWYEQRVPESIAWEYLLWWNNEVLTDSLPLKELEKKMTSWGTITPGCNYITKATYCPRDNTCPHFKNIESGEKAYDSDSAAEAYASSLAESTENYVRLDRVFKNLTFTLKPSRGHIVTIIADSGVGKTILAMLIMLKCTHIHWLFNSYEQGRDEIVERFSKMIGCDMTTTEGRAIYKEATKHIHIIRDGNLTLQKQLKVKHFIENKYNIRIYGMVSDYIGLIPAEHPVKKDQVIYGETESLVQLCKDAKNITESEGFLHIFLSQVPDSKAGNGCVMLRANSAKGSKQIQAMSDLIITAWRHNKGDPNQEENPDNIMTIWGNKFRHGPELEPITYEWFPKQLQVGDVIRRPIQFKTLIKF